ncbi:type II secretion system protein [Hydrogenophaga sp.]|uniref:type II secretion system protein n=1 Tax=Hydrogenophaga sp. TaxID=1904254 RepID=UPI003F6D07F5
MPALRTRPLTAIHRPALPIRLRRQGGFSLIEMALGLLLIAMLMGLTLKSQGLIEQYRQSQFVNHVRVMEAALESYRTQYGRWPGDCDQDGLLDHTLTGTDTANALDYAVPVTLVAAATSDAAYALGVVCPASTLAPYTNPNVAYNELKRGGQTPAGQPNRITAAHKLGGMTYLGHFATTSTNPDELEDRFNAIVMTGVSIATARKLAVAIDGFDGSAANANRVRRSDDMQSFEPLWTAVGESEDKQIDVVLFFDRVPPHSL